MAISLKGMSRNNAPSSRYILHNPVRHTQQYVTQYTTFIGCLKTKVAFVNIYIQRLTNQSAVQHAGYHDATTGVSMRAVGMIDNVI